MFGPCWRSFDSDRRLLCCLLSSRGKKWMKRMPREEQTREVREYMKRSKRRRDNLELRRLSESMCFDAHSEARAERQKTRHATHDEDDVNVEHVWQSILNHRTVSLHTMQKAWKLWKQQQEGGSSEDRHASSSSTHRQHQHANDAHTWHRTSGWQDDRSTWHYAEAEFTSRSSSSNSRDAGKTSNGQRWRERWSSDSAWHQQWQQHWDGYDQSANAGAWQRTYHPKRNPSGVFCERRHTLGLPQHGLLNTAALKASFRRCALAHHPDRHPGAQMEAEARFKQAQEAYQYLQAQAGV